MLRWLGAGLILCGGLLARRTLLESDRSAQRIRRSLAVAFEAMEAELRRLLTPMPALLRRSYGEGADAFFAQASGALAEGVPLAQAWQDAARTVPLPSDDRDALAALGQRLGGGEESVCAALSLAAAALRKRCEKIDAAQPQKERLTTSVCISISLFLAIFLM